MSCSNGQKMTKEEYESFIKKGTALIETTEIILKNENINEITSRLKNVLKYSIDFYYPNHPGNPVEESELVPEVKIGTFEYAIDLLKQGRKVRRSSWDNKFFYIKMSKLAVDNTKDIYICLYDFNGERMNTKGFGLYSIKLSDMSASDWEEVK